MKLLRLKIESKNGFRSLNSGFEVKFHAKSDWESLSSFSPFCLVGLNGCGKSNVMEALAVIFFHIELCISKHLPDYIVDDNIFDTKKCIIDAFTMEYLIKNDLDDHSQRSEWSLVHLTKKEGESPVLTLYEPHRGPIKIFSVLLDGNPIEDNSFVKQFLPGYIVGYSSGENETLSIPFLKSRLLHLEEFKQATVGNYKEYVNPENNLIYIDANMSQAILLCCLLFEEEGALKSLADYDNTGILRIRRFRMCLRAKTFEDVSGKRYSYFSMLKRDLFPILDACSTMSWYDETEEIYYFDFYVNEATKQAFRQYYNSAMECFQMFRLLYELNNYSVSKSKVKEIIESKGVYTDGKVGTPGAENDIFHFLDFYVEKKIDRNGDGCDMLLRQLSDGEHQFIHTMAICLLLKDAESLLLLDEPETHFNPTWRTRFISILDETLQAACDGSMEYVNMRKEILITSHSPFIISDCQSENVLIIDKDDEGNVCAESAAKKGIKTYGTSIGLLMSQIFKSTASIGKRSENGIRSIINQGGSKEEIKKRLNERFGDSVEKLLAIESLR